MVGGMVHGSICQMRHTGIFLSCLAWLFVRCLMGAFQSRTLKLTFNYRSVIDIQQLHLFQVHNLPSFDTCVHLWNHHPIQDNEHMHQHISSHPSAQHTKSLSIISMEETISFILQNGPQHRFNFIGHCRPLKYLEFMFLTGQGSEWFGLFR